MIGLSIPASWTRAVTMRWIWRVESRRPCAVNSGPSVRLPTCAARIFASRGLSMTRSGSPPLVVRSVATRAFEVDVGNIERRRLREPTPRQQHEADERVVASANITFAPAVNQNVDLSCVQHDRWQPAMSLTAQDGGGVARHEPAVLQERVQRLERDAVAVHGRRSPAASACVLRDARARHEPRQRLGRHVAQLAQLLLRREPRERCQVSSVRIDRVRAASLVHKLPQVILRRPSRWSSFPPLVGVVVDGRCYQ